MRSRQARILLQHHIWIRQKVLPEQSGRRSIAVDNMSFPQDGQSQIGFDLVEFGILFEYERVDGEEILWEQIGPGREIGDLVG